MTAKYEAAYKCMIADCVIPRIKMKFLVDFQKFSETIDSKMKLLLIKSFLFQYYEILLIQ